MNVKRVSAGERVLARRTIELISRVFAEQSTEVGDAYLDRLLSNEAFWMLAASAGGSVVGGLTAHTLPMTRGELSEVMIYDVAVAPEHQRQGVGTRLVTELRRLTTGARIPELFVAADDEDQHALDFYRSIGGVSSPVTIFTFRSGDGSGPG